MNSMMTNKAAQTLARARAYAAKVRGEGLVLAGSSQVTVLPAMQAPASVNVFQLVDAVIKALRAVGQEKRAGEFLKAALTSGVYSEVRALAEEYVALS